VTASVLPASAVEARRSTRAAPTRIPKIAHVYPCGPSSLSAPTVIEQGSLAMLAFECMKLIPAWGIISAAMADGRLERGGTVIATSSGTFAHGLAYVCRQLGLRCLAISDPAIDPSFRQLLMATGTELEIVEHPATVGGYQQARLDRVAQRAREMPGAFIADQYGDEHNPLAYVEYGEMLARSVGEVDVLIGTVGSGGSICGLARGLSRSCKPLVVGVDTPSSVIFGCPDGHRPLRGLGNSLLPPNVDHTAFDEIHWMDAVTAYDGTYRLLAEIGRLQGPTAGAAYAVAKWYARRRPQARIAVVLPDSGWRYVNTVFDRGWLERATAAKEPSQEAKRVSHPHEVEPDGWSWLPWRRRTREQALECREPIG
jgi:S-sulfo-L-cysteine synthase (3-phospho-L-serine-dependent)